MTAPATTADEALLLGELATLGMGLAQRLHDAAQTTDDLEALARLGAAFHQVSRGVRQSLALKARFAAGWVPAARSPEVAVAPAPRASQAAAAPVPDRPARTEPTGWTEYERLDSDELLDELDRLAEGPEDEPIDVARFEAALEAGVARLRRGLLALRPTPRAQPAARSHPGPRFTSAPRAGPRAALINGAAALRLADSS